MREIRFVHQFQGEKDGIISFTNALLNKRVAGKDKGSSIQDKLSAAIKTVRWKITAERQLWDAKKLYLDGLQALRRRYEM